MKILYIALGFFSLGFGIIGILLPILPTTPFLLLTAFLFSKGSDKYNIWFQSSKVYKKYLKTFIENKTMTKKQKWILLISVDIMLLISIVSIQNNTVKLLLFLVMIIKHWYFYKFINVLQEN